MNTATPRTDAATYPADCLGTTLVTNRDCARALETELVTLTGAYTCTHHNDQMRTACPVCLVAALTAERDQLRAQLRALTLICGTNDANKFETWVDRANARAERAEAAETVALARWNGALERAIKAEAELAAEREKVRVLRAALENLRDEQNGAPLCTREEQWTQAMDRADAALAVTEDAK
jgi:hypothetical protein